MKWAYYNEIDQQKAAWLRELIRQNVIAPAEVDKRSIAEPARTREVSHERLSRNE